jgi:hypothetical protein
MATKVLDAGGKLMLSGEQRSEVEARLNEFKSRGSKVIAEPQQIGPNWVAACTLPRAKEPEATSSLKLSDPDQPIAKQASIEPEYDDGCTVEEIGFKRLITGPSRQAVELRIEHLKRFGAEVIVEIEENGDVWTAVVDTGGADKTFRW